MMELLELVLKLLEVGCCEDEDDDVGGACGGNGAGAGACGGNGSDGCFGC